MLESQMKQIKNYLGSFLNFFAEDKELQKREYFDKLEQTLELAIKVFRKYNVPNSFKISFSSNRGYLYLFLLMQNDETRWRIDENDKAKSFEESMTTNELVNYCWENNVDLKNLVNSLFDYISQLFSKKEQVFKNEKEKYISEMACLNEAINNLQELVDTDINDEIKNK